MFGWIWLAQSVLCAVIFPHAVFSKTVAWALLMMAGNGFTAAVIVTLGVWMFALDQKWRLRFRRRKPAQEPGGNR